MRELWLLLDLCVLAYQLHAQTLIWPMDPYAEQMQAQRAKGRKIPAAEKTAPHTRRRAFWAATRQYFQQGGGNNPFRGPASTRAQQAQGWINNLHLDPIIQNYRIADPWRPALTRAERGKGWIVYRTPHEITDHISRVYLAEYDANAGPDARPPLAPHASISLLRNRPPGFVPQVAGPLRNDLLYCFEGGTGSHNADDGAAWSLMGFVLAEQIPASNDYNIYIVFRGSRSGFLRPRESMSRRSGNPDWVTDLDEVPIAKTIVNPHNGRQGFLRSMEYTLPPVVGCLEHFANNHLAAGNVRSIYVTGHSLGGALACGFASAIMCGRQYGPDAQNLQPNLQAPGWPWPQMKLVMFSAPAVGTGIEFMNSVNGRVPNSTRVYLPQDPIPKTAGLYHVGSPIELKAKLFAVSFDAHDPFYVRLALKDYMTQQYPGFVLWCDQLNQFPYMVDQRLADAMRRFDPNMLIRDVLQPYETSIASYFRIFGNILGAEGIPRPRAPGSVQIDQNALRAWINSYVSQPQPAAPAFPNLVVGGNVQTPNLTAIARDQEFKDFMINCLVLLGLSRTPNATAGGGLLQLNLPAPISALAANF
jgi:hypothetical protein